MKLRYLQVALVIVILVLCAQVAHKYVPIDALSAPFVPGVQIFAYQGVLLVVHYLVQVALSVLLVLDLVRPHVQLYARQVAHSLAPMPVLSDVLNVVPIFGFAGCNKDEN